MGDGDGDGGGGGGGGGKVMEVALSRCSRPALYRGPAGLPAWRWAQEAALSASSSLEPDPALPSGQCRGVSPERGSFPRALPRMRFSSGLCGASFAERIVEARAVPPGEGAHCL